MNFINLFSKLISYKTVSRTSNEKLMLFIKNYLLDFNIKSELLEGSKGQFNMYSRVGPNKDGGLILSGHTDVVPTEGQNWETEPFCLTKKGNKL